MWHFFSYRISQFKGWLTLVLCPKCKYVYFQIPLSIKKEYSSNTKDGEGEIKHVQIGTSGD